MLDSVDTLIAFALIMLVVSLLITIVVQMIGSIANLRGINLVRGLEETFEIVTPSLEGKAKDLAKHVLSGPMISDSSFRWLPRFWRIASAVRPDEVFDAVHRIAIGREATPDSLRAGARDLLIALGVSKASLDQAGERIAGAQTTAKNLTTKAAEAVESLPKSELQTSVQDALGNVSRRLTAYATDAATKIAQDAITAANVVDHSYQNFEYWLATSQERAQQWFTMHTRMFSVLFACIFAFLLQLDTVEIFRLVSTNRAVRDKLVAQATAVSTQAEKILGDSKSVLQKAFDGWLAGQDEKVKTALASIAIKPSETREKFTQRVEGALAPNADKEKLLKDFNEAIDKAASDTLKEQAGDYSAVKADLDQTGFDLFPKDSRGRWKTGWNPGSHWLGILFSAGLLSLGAPFWYNILKSLASLRSAVAQNISDEKKESQKKLDSDKPGDPPPTTLPPAATAAQNISDEKKESQEKLESDKPGDSPPPTLPPGAAQQNLQH